MKRKQIKESDSKFIYRKKKANREIENTALKGSINKFLSIQSQIGSSNTYTNTMYRIKQRSS